jgi:hypothetical protein
MPPKEKPNDPCSCGSQKKYKKCCGATSLTDKFSMLFCCKSFFEDYQKKWEKVNILFACQLGQRYFVKIESLSEELSKTCHSMSQDRNALFIDPNDKDGKFKHFGMVFEENRPHCVSKFSSNYKECMDPKCNLPNINKFDKLMCMQMTCTECANTKRCAGKQSCDKLLGIIKQNYQFLNRLKEENDEKFIPDYMKKLSNFPNKDKIPSFLLEN